MAAAQIGVGPSPAFHRTYAVETTITHDRTALSATHPGIDGKAITQPIGLRIQKPLK